MIGSAANGLNVIQLAANIAYLTGAGYALFKLLDRAFGKRIEAHVSPVMDALVAHMGEEESGMKTIAKGQKKIARKFDDHAKADAVQFAEVRKTLEEIQTKGRP